MQPSDKPTRFVSRFNYNSSTGADDDDDDAYNDESEDRTAALSISRHVRMLLRDCRAARKVLAQTSLSEPGDKRGIGCCKLRWASGCIPFASREEPNLFNRRSRTELNRFL